MKKYLFIIILSFLISSSGPFVREFEKRFAKRVNRKFAISVSNGTAALQLAYESLNIKKKEEVILPSFTIISCILPIIRSGAIPILIDSDPVTWNMDVNKIEKKITSKTRAIIAPHIYGLPIDMDPLLKIAQKYNYVKPTFSDDKVLHLENSRHPVVEELLPFEKEFFHQNHFLVYLCRILSVYLAFRYYLI